MSDLMGDAFGRGPTDDGLTPQQIAALEPLAHQLRDNALAIIQTVFGKEASIHSVSTSSVTSDDVETMLVGDYFLLEANLQSPRGELFPCLTFLHRDELVAGFDLEVPADPADATQQIARLQNPLELMVDAVNAQLGSNGGIAPTFVRPTVRVVNLPEDAAQLLLTPNEPLLQLSYQLELADVGELEVVTIASADLARHVAQEDRAEEDVSDTGDSTGRRPTPDELLGLAGDPLITPTGRTPADILGDIPTPSETRRGGMGMASSPPSSFAGSGRDAGVVRPAQFQPFGEGGDREIAANIDLIMDVNLRITVELGRTTMSIREVLDLGPGAVVELDKLAGEPVDILVNDKPIAKGEVVVVDENFGVRVTDIISPQKRVASLR